MMEAVAAPAPLRPGDTADAITVEHVSKWFPSAEGRLHVLQDIALSIAEHEIVAILGASGCGKSTLLNIISGLVKPDQGRVCINGVPSESYRNWREVSYMFQEDRLLPWRSAAATVECFCASMRSRR
jgi:ABC-type nitrate/sulfonate/bicarbonate transport system ATPase subunit